MLSKQRLLVLIYISAALLLYTGIYTKIIASSLQLTHNISIFSDILYPPDPPPPATATAPKSDHISPHRLKFPSLAWTSEPSPEDNFDGLLDLCKETNWIEGLWIHCHSNCGTNGTSICGGLNNARNRVQTCIRLAIDAGSGIIIPSATTRVEEELVKTDGKTVCPDVFWNMEYLQSAMAKACPQMQMRFCDDRSGIDTILEPPFRMYLTPPHTKGTFLSLVKSTFDLANMSISSVNATNPAVVKYGDTYIGWNYQASSELSTIRKAFFKVLKFNQDLLDLSSQVLQAPELNEGAFIGVHLRGENDWPGGFGSLDDQMRLYKEEIEHIQTTISYKVETVYVSCGDPEAIQRFRSLLEPSGYVVHDKWTLLKTQPETLAKVEALAFDEKGIVEYQVLVDARFWMGIITSSMSSLIAYARTVGEEGDYFEKYVFPGSEKSGLNRNYKEHLSMKGGRYTKLMVVNGVDIMECFP